MSSLFKRGRCHVLGDGIPLDEGFIPFELAIQRVTDPAKLIPHLFERVAPGFSSRAKPGDIVIAGNEFACGKPHVQGFIALRALDMGVVCVSMPFKNLRRAVAKGLPVVTGAPSPAEIASDGDDVEIDFATGQGFNHTRGTRLALPAMPPILLEIVQKGGMEALLKSWLVEHPEQAAGPEDRAVLDTVMSAPVTMVKKAA
jgi:3-isopropylmalate/(R)-2-methylmalate dehydratase small subunit